MPFFVIEIMQLFALGEIESKMIAGRTCPRCIENDKSQIRYTCIIF